MGHLSELSDDEFLRWAQGTGFGELAELMLWRWDPHDCADEFPSSSDTYEGVAQTVLYGLRAGDDASRFAQRLRANQGEITDPRYLDDPTLERLHARIQRCLALSLPRWRNTSALAALRALPFHCHIIKYDPARIVSYYDDGTWTSISDIGKRFNGEVLTREQYELVEAALVDTVLAMCHESGIATLEPMPELTDEQTAPAVDVDAFADHLRRMLREEHQHYRWRDPQLRFYVTAGFDYHLYAGSHVPCPRAVDLARDRGLHPVTGTVSPWLHDS